MYMQYDKHVQKTDMVNANNVYSTANSFLGFRIQPSKEAYKCANQPHLFPAFAVLPCEVIPLAVLYGTTE